MNADTILESEFRCRLIIIDEINDITDGDVNPSYKYKYNNFSINGEEPIEIDYEFDISKIVESEYEFEIRKESTDELIYSTAWNDTIQDFLAFTDTEKMSKKDKDSLLDEMTTQYLIINKPFIFTETTCISLYSIKMIYQLFSDDYCAHHHKIISFELKFRTDKWLDAIQKYDMGHIYKINKIDLPPCIYDRATKLKTHSINQKAFSVLWLYRYHTGDVFIINVEQAGSHKNKMAQYYISAHLHINNNKCGNCHDDCVHEWSESDWNNLELFLLENSEYLKVKWYEESSIIEYKGEIFIRQNTNCAYVDKSIVKLNTI